MTGAWLIGTIIDGRDYWKCSKCGQLQVLSLFNGGMRYCSTCGDYKTIVHRVKQLEKPIQPNYWNHS